MAYTNAIYYLNYELGSDTARAGFAGVASNPSGTTTLITAVGHGLVTGAVVVLSGFTAWLNSSWKITWVDADTFTLDDATWAATADPNGTVTPNGGMNWTDAWKTMTSGATAARIQAGDVMRMAKSPAPSSIGTATWTDLSITVTLDAAQTADIDMCETAWTANGAGDVTVALTAKATDAKQGDYCMKFTTDAAVQASIMQAYFQIADTDFSDYQKISFWFKNQNAVTANMWKICLCSDTAGATPVDTFLIPAVPSTLQWIPFTLTKEGGGNLGSSIQSIAIYSDSSAPTASKYIYVDDFIACTTDGLNLQSLISKNSLEQGGDEAWIGLQSISGVTLKLDADNNSKSGTGRGYAGDTENVTTYKRETIKVVMTATSIGDTGGLSTTEAGTAAALITYSGGWNTGVGGTCDGETFFDGLNGFGVNTLVHPWNNWSRINPIRFFQGIRMDGTDGKLFLENLQTCANCWYPIMANGIPRILSAKNVVHNQHGITSVQNPRAYIEIDYIRNISSNVYYALEGYSGSDPNSLSWKIKDFGQIKNNGYAAFFDAQYKFDRCYAANGTIANETELFTTGTANASGNPVLKNVTLTNVTYYLVGAGVAENNNTLRILFSKYNKTAYDKISGANYVIDSMDTDRGGGSGVMWRTKISTANYDGTYNPIPLSVAKIAVKANKAVSISAYVKKSHATNVGAKLVVKGKQIAGIETDVEATASTADTDWHSLALADVTPTEAGVIEVEFWGYYVAGTGYVYIEDFTISQAA